MAKINMKKIIEQENQEKEILKKIFLKLEERHYSWASFIVEQVLELSNSKDIEDICDSLRIYANVECFKIESLSEQYKFEAFKQEISENPYQLKLIA